MHLTDKKKITVRGPRQTFLSANKAQKSLESWTPVCLDFKSTCSGLFIERWKRPETISKFSKSSGSKRWKVCTATPPGFDLTREQWEVYPFENAFQGARFFKRAGDRWFSSQWPVRPVHFPWKHCARIETYVCKKGRWVHSGGSARAMATLYSIFPAEVEWVHCPPGAFSVEESRKEDKCIYIYIYIYRYIYVVARGTRRTLHPCWLSITTTTALSRFRCRSPSRWLFRVLLFATRENWRALLVKQSRSWKGCSRSCISVKRFQYNGLMFRNVPTKEGQTTFRQPEAITWFEDNAVALHFFFFFFSLSKISSFLTIVAKDFCVQTINISRCNAVCKIRRSVFCCHLWSVNEQLRIMFVSSLKWTTRWADIGSLLTHSWISVILALHLTFWYRTLLNNVCVIFI